MQHWELFLFFIVIAFVYASVGFGGGSSYLAILSLYALPLAEIKLTALVCNIIVVTGGTLIFIKNKQVNWRKVLPLIITSVPMAFLGARWKLEQTTFFIILGISLVTASVLLWIRMRPKEDLERITMSTNIYRDAIIGGLIGFLSGMVGIGGGIFLSPILLMCGWDTPKKIAATASLFILVNSISCIAGQLSHPTSGINFTQIGILCAAVFVGGQIGSRLGAVKFDQLLVRRMTALLVFVAGIDVLAKHLHWFK